MSKFKFQVQSNKNFRFYIPLNSDVTQSNIIDIKKIFNEATIVLKDDPTSTVKKIKLGDDIWVIKRENLRNLNIKIKRLVGPSRAYRSFINAFRLEQIGITSIKPIAAIEEKVTCFFKGRSFFISEYIEGILAQDYFAYGALVSNTWPDIAKQIIDLVLTLAKNKLVHRDLNLSNLLIKQQRVYLLDLDSMHMCRTYNSAKKNNYKQMQRFLENLIELPGSEAAVELFRPMVGECLKSLCYY